MFITNIKKFISDPTRVLLVSETERERVPNTSVVFCNVLFVNFIGKFPFIQKYQLYDTLGEKKNLMRKATLTIFFDI